MADYWLGIDLGTYNSSAVIKSKQGDMEIVKSQGERLKDKIPFLHPAESHKEFPSFISFNKDGSINEVGINSKEKAYTEPEFVVWGIKRLLGKTYTELKESGELDRFPYQIRPDRTNGQCLIVIGNAEELDRLPLEVNFPDFLKDKIRYDAYTKRLIFKGKMVENEKEELLKLSEDRFYKKAIETLFQRSSIGEKSYTPVQLCKEIFNKIKSDAEKQKKMKIDSVVVSVPAYFDPSRVTPIVEAARLAGFINIKTVPEPVAATLAYHIDITVKPIKVLVFDLGAGTLDVTAGYLYRHPDKANEFMFQVLKNTGDPRLGGIDMDDRLLKLIQERFQLSDVTQANKALLRRTAEIVKIRLSEETDITQEFELDNGKYHCMIDQLDLKSALEGKGGEKNLLEECRRQIMAAIHEAGWTPQEVELLIMIGGPTKLPCIHEVFKIIFHNNPIILQQLEEFYSGREKVDRMTAVSIGAAMSVERKVDDRIPYGFGIEDIEFGEEEMTYLPKILIPRDSTYPFKSTPYQIRWVSRAGIFEFKIIQHVPNSAVEQAGYEHRFMGIQKFTVKNPDMCMVVLQMGYNANKELEVTIKNAYTTEFANYIGINNFQCIGMKYPMTVKRRPDGPTPIKPKKIPPSPETLERFIKWGNITIRNIQIKADNFPVPQMDTIQTLDETRRLIERGDIKAEYGNIYNKLNVLIHNSSTRGLLTQAEFIELLDHLTKFEGELFRIG